MKKIRTAIFGIAVVLSMAFVHGVPAKAAEERNINRDVQLNNGTEVSIDGDRVTVIGGTEITVRLQEFIFPRIAMREG